MVASNNNFVHFGPFHRLSALPFAIPILIEFCSSIVSHLLPFPVFAARWSILSLVCVPGPSTPRSMFDNLRTRSPAEGSISTFGAGLSWSPNSEENEISPCDIRAYPTMKELEEYIEETLGAAARERFYRDQSPVSKGPESIDTMKIESGVASSNWDTSSWVTAQSSLTKKTFHTALGGHDACTASKPRVLQEYVQRQSLIHGSSTQC